MYIDPNLGFVHFVLANLDDSCYTEQNLKFDFYGYLCNSLSIHGFNSFFAFEGSGADNCRMLPLNSVSKQLSASMTVKKSGFFKKNEDGFDPNGNVSLAAALIKLFDIMKKQQGMVLIIPCRLFVMVLNDPVVFKIIKKLPRSGYNRNIIILTSPVNTFAGIDILSVDYFVSCDIMSSEIRRNFGKPYFYPYQELKNELQNRMLCLNDMSYQNVSALVHNYFLKHYSCIDPVFSNMKWYAGIIWAWHNIDAFRYKYPDLLKNNDNIYRKNSVVEQMLGNRDFTRNINSIISEIPDKEKNDPQEYFIEVYGEPADRNGLYVVDDAYDKISKAMDEICRMYYNISGRLPDKLEEVKLKSDKCLFRREPDTLAEDYLLKYISFMKSKLSSAYNNKLGISDDLISCFCEAVNNYYKRIEITIDPIVEETKFKIVQERFVLYYNVLRLSAYRYELKLKNEILFGDDNAVKEYRCEQLMNRAEELLDILSGEYTESVYKKMGKLSADICSEVI